MPMPKLLLLIASLLMAQHGIGAWAREVEVPKDGGMIAAAFDKSAEPVHFFRDGIDVTVTPHISGDKEYPMVETEVRISGSSMVPLVVKEQMTGAGYEHQYGIFKLSTSDKSPSVLIQNYSGGAHCCNNLVVVRPLGGKLQVIDMGMYDGEGLTDIPKDIDGDGNVDFTLLDQNFLYAFGSYAESWAVTKVWNIYRTQMVDVSRDPAFRSIYTEQEADMRKACIGKNEGQGYQNPACAAYVAVASITGHYDSAWKEMLANYDKTGDQWPNPCFGEYSDSGCAAGKGLKFANFPDALKYFLGENGYGASATAGE
jgi:hypothetical protein